MYSVPPCQSSAPVSSAASYATSGKPRKVNPAGVVPTICVGLSHEGEYSNWLNPPPPDCHACSPRYVPSTLLNRSVPPTATAYGDEAGYSTIGTPPTPPGGGPPATPQYAPVSPVEAKSVWPCAAASTRIMSPTSM